MVSRVDELEDSLYISKKQIVSLNDIHDIHTQYIDSVNGKAFYRATGHSTTEKNSEICKFIDYKIKELVCTTIADLKEEVVALEKAHTYKSEENIIFDDGRTVITGGKRIKVFNHDGVKVDTDKVKDVTFQEIARLVMDDEPIVRKTMEEKTNYYGRKVD